MSEYRTETLDIEQYAQGDDAFKELQLHFANIFKNVDPNQDYTVSSIERAFEAIGKKVPQIVLDAHRITQKTPSNSIKRAELMVEMYAIAENLSVLFAEWDRFLDRLQLVMYPAKVVQGQTLTDADRKIRMEAKLAPFKQVRDILFYLLSYCAKVGPSIHQSVLNLERDLLKGTNIS